MHRSRRVNAYELGRRKVSNSSYKSLLLVINFLFFNTLLWLHPLSEREAPSSPPDTGVKNSHLRVGVDELKRGIMPLTDADNNNNKASTLFGSVNSSSLLHVQFTGRKKLWTLKDMMAVLDASKENNSNDVPRTVNVCPSLTDNLMIPTNETFEIGMFREFIGGMYHPIYCKQWKHYGLNESTKKKGDNSKHTETSASPLCCDADSESNWGRAMHRPPRYAYMMMVSNHLYLDGAMVLADSIREHSALSRNCRAEIVLMINENIREEMYPLLQVMFDRVQIFHGLQKFAPKSFFKATFDKMYLYLQEDYTDGILFLDADSLIVGNPDSLLEMYTRIGDVMNSTDWKNTPRYSEFSHLLSRIKLEKIIHSKTIPLLFAVGNKYYFKTGLLLLRPSLHVFLRLYLEFRFGSFDRNKVQARDGTLFRKCFNDIGELYRRPSFIYHCTGTPKPWFNEERAEYSLQPVTVRLKAPLERTWKDYKYYYEWWTRYEKLHVENFQPIEMETRKEVGALQDKTFYDFLEKYRNGVKRERNPKEIYVTKYGGMALLRSPTKRFPLPFGIKSLEETLNVSPNAYMWLLRFNRQTEYLHPTRKHMAELRKGSLYLAHPDELRSFLASLNTSERQLKKKKENVVYAFAAMHAEEDNNTKDGYWINCDVECSKFNLKCNASLLLDTRIADCQYSTPAFTMTNALIHCKRCLPYYKAGAPFVVFQKQKANDLFVKEAEVCFFNAWTRFSLPLCNASKPRLYEYDLQPGEALAPVCPCY